MQIVQAYRPLYFRLGSYKTADFMIAIRKEYQRATRVHFAEIISGPVISQPGFSILLHLLKSIRVLFLYLLSPLFARAFLSLSLSLTHTHTFSRDKRVPRE